ncbi:MAG: hypothetical protein RLZZ324_1202 [Candidatus Parcubacteria bacterium]|jgi:hypothetical protein
MTFVPSLALIAACGIAYAVFSWRDLRHWHQQRRGLRYYERAMAAMMQGCEPPRAGAERATGTTLGDALDEIIHDGTDSLLLSDIIVRVTRAELRFGNRLLRLERLKYWAMVSIGVSPVIIAYAFMRMHLSEPLWESIVIWVAAVVQSTLILHVQRLMAEAIGESRFTADRVRLFHEQRVIQTASRLQDDDMTPGAVAPADRSMYH